MKRLRLSNGKYALLDEAGYQKCRPYSWCVDNQGYARAKIRGSLQKMHRFLIEAPIGMCVDHINGKKLDNRSLNLRLCNRTENSWNRHKLKTAATSKYKGVYRQKPSYSWQAKIQCEGHSVYLGTFSTEEDAARAYNEAAKQFQGEFCSPNPV